MPTIHLNTSFEFKIFNMEFMMCKIVLQQIFWDLSLSPAHYCPSNFQSYINVLSSSLSLVGTGGAIQGGKTIIWSLTLKVKHRIRVFEKRVLKKVHHKELHNCHSSPDITSQSNRYYDKNYSSEYIGHYHIW